MNTPGFIEVFLSLALVALAIGLTVWWKIPVQKDMSLGSVRAFVQLVAVGYVLKYIFALESILLVFLAMMVMITVGAYTASERVKKIKGTFVVAFLAIFIGSAVTIAVLLLLKVISFEARYVIPLAGMIISNSMNATTLTINRISADIIGNRLAVETALALGKSWRVATRTFQREAAIAGMISTLNFMKTVGIVALPGAMTGMILAGAEPVKAVLFQIIVAYMLLSVVTISTIVALELTVRRFFTPFHQLRLDIL
ncbi:MAG: iron export ABC transporter permease subunit FetB [candidate division Zixibacteria bacterium]|nr:iron export ABC transporter permease subunit FetB [candidate division Zixibacteria bacterium]MDD5425327.1 iron export ABC transporter permease subunit FetB [candidate division Zixibacteria bacterium]